MKKLSAVLCSLVLIFSVSACGYPNLGKKAPDNWPTYAIGNLTFPCEAGWTASDVSGFADASAEPFQLLNTADQVQWVGCIASPEWTTKSRNFFAISYLQLSSEFTDRMLEDQLEGLSDLKAAFLSVNMTATVLSQAQIGKYGPNTALTFVCRFTMEDGQKMIVHTALMGHGDRLYQFHLVDYQSAEAADTLAQILNGLRWIE